MARSCRPAARSGRLRGSDAPASAFSADALGKLKPKLEKLKQRFGANTENLVAMALNYVLAMPRVACVIPGFRNQRQARMNVDAAGKTMSEEDLKYIRETLAK